MNTIELTKAIKHIKPTAEFSFNDTDYSSIEWIKLEGDAPTLAEIEVADKAVKTAEAQAEAEAQAKRSAALSKLEALGLDEDDLKALGL